MASGYGSEMEYQGTLFLGVQDICSFSLLVFSGSKSKFIAIELRLWQAAPIRELQDEIPGFKICVFRFNVAARLAFCTDFCPTNRALRINACSYEKEVQRTRLTAIEAKLSKQAALESKARRVVLRVGRIIFSPTA